MSIVLSVAVAMADFLAQATPASQPAQQPPGIVRFLYSLGPIAPMVLVLLLLLVFTQRSKQKQEKQRQTLLNSLKRNDRVQTIGGVLGNVVDVRPDRVLLKVDESNNTKVWFTRNAIHRVVEDDKIDSK